MDKKILVTERIADEGIDTLRDRGYEVDVKLGLAPNDLRSLIGDYDALIVRSGTVVDQDLLDAAKKLKIIGRAGVTVDNIDIACANEKGIIVCNAPSSNIISTAEHTMGLMLAAARMIPQANESMHDGKWSRGDFSGTELYGKTLAIFGLGRVGSAVAERAGAFGMRMIAYDPYCSDDRAKALGVELVDSIDAAIEQADFITMHLPRTADTVGMFGAREFAKMKKGVIVVNSARGGIYDIDALADFLAAGKVRGCAIDIFEEEPCLGSPLHELDAAVLTPHISAVTEEAQIRASEQIAEYIWEGLEGSIVPTAINASNLPPEVMDSLVPYGKACRIAGKLAKEILGTMPSKVDVNLLGTLANEDPLALVGGVVEGIVSYKGSQAKTVDDAIARAKRHGFDVSIGSRPEASGFESAVSVKADDVQIAVTLYGLEGVPRVISLLGYDIDIAPTQNGIVFEYEDGPGKIGAIGTTLGEAGVNITTMQIGTKPKSNYALVYMNIDSELSESTMDQLKGSVDYKNAWSIRL